MVGMTLTEGAHCSAGDSHRSKRSSEVTIGSHTQSATHAQQGVIWSAWLGRWSPTERSGDRHPDTTAATLVRSFRTKKDGTGEL